MVTFSIDDKKYAVNNAAFIDYLNKLRTSEKLHTQSGTHIIINFSKTSGNFFIGPDTYETLCKKIKKAGKGVALVDAIKKSVAIKGFIKVTMDITAKLIWTKDHLDEAEHLIGYTFNNKNYLIQAFIAKSADTKKSNSGPLEIIGDRILYAIATQEYLNDFASFNDIGFLTMGNLSAFADKITEATTNITFQNILFEKGLDKFIIASGKCPKKIYANCFEAIIGAVAIDTDFDMVQIKKVYEYLINPARGHGLLNRIKKEFLN